MEAPARPEANAPVAEERLAPLREEIRRAGEEAYHRRLWVDPLCALLAFGVLWGPVVVARWSGWLSEVPTGLLMAITLLGSVVFVRTSQAVAARWRRRRLPIRRSIDTLPRAELASLLKSLCADPDVGTREFAQALARDLGLPTEVTPAGTPEGSGAEVSGVDRRAVKPPG